MYQSVLEHVLPKADFSIGTYIYMLESNLNLNIGKTAGYNNEILISNIDIKINSNRKINKAEIYPQIFTKFQSLATPLVASATREMHLMKSLDDLIKYTMTILAVGNQKMLPEK